MQVEVMYNQGVLALEVNAGAPAMLERVNAILAPFQHLLAQAKPISLTDYKAMWHEHLEEKYLNQHEKSDI